MSDILIDPPVTPFSSEAEIQSWIEELDVMRTRFADDSDALIDVARAKKRAEEMLALKRQA